MIGIRNLYHYFQPLKDNEPLPKLAPAIREVCTANVRRIDRFVQLALLGAAHCAYQQPLRPDCAIYLGSGHGPVSNNVITQQQLIRDGLTPKPVNFINTLGTSAGFHIARVLKTNGQNHFISRLSASFEATLTMALADLTLGVASQALVGIVEEIVPPFSDHRRRQHLPADLPLAEGSHWLLLDNKMNSTSQVTLQTYNSDTAHSAVDNDNKLKTLTSMTVPQNIALVKKGAMTGFHDSLTGARVVDALSHQQPIRLMTPLDDTHKRLFNFLP